MSPTSNTIGSARKPNHKVYSSDMMKIGEMKVSGFASSHFNLNFKCSSLIQTVDHTR